MTELDFGLLKQRKNLLKQRKEAFETSFLCFSAEGQGFFLAKASSTITNPRVLTLIQKKGSPKTSFLWRKDRDSNPGNAFDVYTLSRRASSTTRASFRICECKDSAFWVYIAYLLRFFLRLFVIVYAFDSRRNRCEDFVCDCV